MTIKIFDLSDRNASDDIIPILQEKIDQIRKKNQMNQFDDLSDLDDEGVFFHK